MRAGVPAGMAAAALVLLAAVTLRAGLTGRFGAACLFRVHRIADGRGRGRGRGPAAARVRRLLDPPRWLAPRLHDAGVAEDPGAVWTAWVGAGAIATVSALALVGPGAGVLAAGLALCGPCVGWRLLRHRGAARLEAALPFAVEAVAAGLRSGASLRQALAESARATPGPVGADLAAVTTAVERGAAVVAALEGWGARRPLPGVRLVVAALCLGAETGGATAQAVDAVAAALRQRLAVQAEARALATQARVSAAVIATAPLAFCALSTVTDPRSADFLLRTPEGLLLLVAGLCLDTVGALWMARLTRVEP